MSLSSTTPKLKKQTSNFEGLNRSRASSLLQDFKSNQINSGGKAQHHKELLKNMLVKKILTQFKEAGSQIKRLIESEVTQFVQQGPVTKETMKQLEFIIQSKIKTQSRNVQQRQVLSNQDVLKPASPNLEENAYKFPLERRQKQIYASQELRKSSSKLDQEISQTTHPNSPQETSVDLWQNIMQFKTQAEKHEILEEISKFRNKQEMQRNFLENQLLQQKMSQEQQKQMTKLERDQFSKLVQLQNTEIRVNNSKEMLKKAELLRIRNQELEQVIQRRSQLREKELAEVRRSMDRDEQNLRLIQQEEEFKRKEKDRIQKMTMQLGLQNEQQRRATQAAKERELDVKAKHDQAQYLDEWQNVRYKEYEDRIARMNLKQVQVDKMGLAISQSTNDRKELLTQKRLLQGERERDQEEITRARFEEMDRKQKQELLRTELQKQKLHKSEFERLEKQKIMAYGSETRNSDHKAIMQEVDRQQQANKRKKILAQQLLQQVSEKKERDKKIGMSPEEEGWQQSYLEQLKQKEDLINKGLNVNIKPIPQGRKRGIAFYEDSKGILNFQEPHLR